MHYPSFCKLRAEYGQDERVSSFISFRNWMHEYQCRTFVDLCLDCWNLIIYSFTTDLFSLQLFIGWQIFWKIFKGEFVWNVTDDFYQYLAKIGLSVFMELNNSLLNIKGTEFLSQTLLVSILYIFSTQCRRPLIF